MEPSAPIKNEGRMFGFRNEVDFLVDSGGDCFIFHALPLRAF